MRARSETGWLAIRRYLASPPSTVDRRHLKAFSASLRQAESYFDAALAAGPETGPVSTYYGLLQLGRAAQLVAGVEPSGHHGFESVRPSGKDVFKTVLTTRDEDSHFVASISASRGRAWTPDSTKISLETLIDSHLELHDLFPSRDGKLRPLLVRPFSGFDSSVRHGFASPPSGSYAWVAARGKISDEDFAQRLNSCSGIDEEWTIFSRLFAPKMGPTEQPEYEHLRLVHWPEAFDVGREDGKFSDVVAQWLHTPPNSDDSFFVQNDHYGARWGPTAKWWPIMYAFGSVARYEPDEWLRWIDMDKKVHAADVRETWLRSTLRLPTLGRHMIDSAFSNHRSHLNAAVESMRSWRPGFSARRSPPE